MSATLRPGSRHVHLVQPRFPPSYWGMEDFLELTPYRGCPFTCEFCDIIVMYGRAVRFKPVAQVLAEAHKTQNEKLDLVEAVHKVQSYNLFVSAGMIVGFDHDDADIFEEQYAFLQEAQIPLAMVSALLAVPRTPLYRRLEAQGRLRTARASGTPTSRYAGTDGGTNFEPLRMSAEQLRAGQRRLYRRLYAPGAFGARLLGNLGRFHGVRYRPEPPRRDNLVTFLRLAARYWRQGGAARRFFWGTLWKALWRSPRSLSQAVILLGMYEHFRKVHGDTLPWDPRAGQPGEEVSPATAPPAAP